MLIDKIKSDLKDALRGKRELELSTLRLALASVQNKEKEKRYKLANADPKLVESELDAQSKLRDDEIVEVLFSEAKKRKDAIFEFSVHGGSATGGQKEKIESHVKKETKELEILKKYLPEQLSPQVIKKEVLQAIEAVGAKDLKDMGKVMAIVMLKLKGKAQGNDVSQAVKELLSKSN